ncbi:hypothetical protein NPIL_275091 [Nephila pilipes]|uniref:Uncharacterized protein n=1 Tax=Nephila pilipes TaxID=299642 RepID=A0A8X6NNX5_NEPPI|nr:hypothetical protein NPIL_275091 [Nephila pilipes]
MLPVVNHTKGRSVLPSSTAAGLKYSSRRPSLMKSLTYISSCRTDRLTPRRTDCLFLCPVTFIWDSRDGMDEWSISGISRSADEYSLVRKERWCS